MNNFQKLFLKATKHAHQVYAPRIAIMHSGWAEPLFIVGITRLETRVLTQNRIFFKKKFKK